MRVKSTDNKLYFTAGTASTRVRGEKIPVEYIHYNDPSCGSYIDPRGFLVLPNFNSVSGDIDERFALYIVNGAVEVDTLVNVTAAVNAFCLNTAISATGVTISGCLTDTDLTEGTRQLTATVLPLGALQTGTWTSSVPTRATVSSTGLVTYVGATAGDTVITFTSTDGAFTATCTITVTEAE
jgi:uncharacterized protein YjdB